VARVPPVSAGADWGPDGSIVYARTFNGALWRVRDTGGIPEQITTLDESRAERAHVWPQILRTEDPAGDRARPRLPGHRGLGGRGHRPRDRRAHGAAGGRDFARVVGGDRIVFARGTQVFSSPFDPKTLRAEGAAQPIALPIAISADVGVPELAVSGSGTLVFIEGGAQRMTRSALVALDRSGRRKQVLLADGVFSNPVLSPDGRRVAMQVCEGFSCKLFALELGRGVLTPVARDPGRFFGPLVPDGRRLAFRGSSDEPEARPEGLGRQRRDRGADRGEPARPGVQRLVVAGGAVRALLARLHRPVARREDRRARPVARRVRRGRKGERAPLVRERGDRVRALLLARRAVRGLRLGRVGRQEIYCAPSPARASAYRSRATAGSSRPWSKGGREIVSATGAASTRSRSTPRRRPP